MKKWLALIVVVVVLALGWLAAGPFVAIHGIRSAVQEQDAAKLSEYVDFAAVRSSLKQQVDDYLARRAGADLQSNLLGAIALRLASGASEGMVDAMATPAGLAAVMEGRNFWHRVTGQRSSNDAYASAPPRDPLEGAKYRYESLSRFSATVRNADGDPVVFVLSRQGLRWKVTEVRVPFLAASPTDGP
ncbi:DUF2939 domain-containing protein [Lysobacter solisilvae (ex Woo and Kim 2020)]|uniref:DUF2939 domain-containing protein n=1 Tax=Agrilutibacter terrestris TaxID=2865112 RepID=A0A7H0FXQ4_9GAMM|nr:DUF2939 domain-containing protein [Lysobacter terrestris]QNP40820.1 DUF2939 domain-containing protein [Lysobacter terrestris]